MAALNLTTMSASAAQPDPNAGAYTGEIIECEFDGVERVVAISRVTGEIERLRALLEQMEVIDAQGDWIGGETHLVQMGNVFGRSEYVDEAARYLWELQNQAEEAGGAVHVLLGMTEYTILLNQPAQLDYKSYARFAGDNAAERKQELLERNLEEYSEFLGDNPKRDFYLERFENFFEISVFEGAAEFFDTIARGTEFGDWLRSRNAVVRINDIVYSCSGISPSYKDLHIVEINQRIRNDIASKDLYLEPRLDLQSPIWWSGPLTGSDGDIHFVIEDVLQEMGIPMMMIGRTRFTEAVTRRGRLIYVESRIPDRYRSENMAAVEITPEAIKSYEAGAAQIFGGTTPLDDEK